MPVVYYKQKIFFRIKIIKNYNYLLFTFDSMILSSSFSKGYEVIIHTKEKESQITYLDLLNRHNVKYVHLPLNNKEDPPLDIWFETVESINLGFDLPINGIRLIKAEI
jgi:hypothetical protein